MQDYTFHLSKDKKIKKLLETNPVFKLKAKKDLCRYLCASIMSQQLSTKVATVIHNRFLQLYSNKNPAPQQIIDTPFETLRAIGLSNAKAHYVQNVARFAIEQGIEYRQLNKMDNESVIDYLTQIKGVGRWTVEMLLMFALAREDVFAIDDWGIQNAMIHLYKLDRGNKKEFKESLLQISGKWAPYRTYACLHLWQWKDNPPIKK